MKTRGLSILGYNREIDRLEAEIEWLRGVIRTLDCLDPFTCGRGDYLCPSCEFSEPTEGEQTEAALEDGDDER